MASLSSSPGSSVKKGPSPEEKLQRKRLAARLRQQRCRARKRKLAMELRIAKAGTKSCSRGHIGFVSPPPPPRCPALPHQRVALAPTNSAIQMPCLSPATGPGTMQPPPMGANNVFYTPSPRHNICTIQASPSFEMVPQQGTDAAPAHVEADCGLQHGSAIQSAPHRQAAVVTPTSNPVQVAHTRHRRTGSEIAKRDAVDAILALKTGKLPGPARASSVLANQEYESTLLPRAASVATPKGPPPRAPTLRHAPPLKKRIPVLIAPAPTVEQGWGTAEVQRSISSAQSNENQENPRPIYLS